MLLSWRSCVKIQLIENLITLSVMMIMVVFCSNVEFPPFPAEFQSSVIFSMQKILEGNSFSANDMYICPKSYMSNAFLTTRWICLKLSQVIDCLVNLKRWLSRNFSCHDIWQSYGPLFISVTNGQILVQQCSLYISICSYSFSRSQDLHVFPYIKVQWTL